MSVTADYNKIKRLASGVFGFFLGKKSRGGESIPEEGPVIFAANHINMFDPVMIAVRTKRKLTFMAKAELFTKFIIKNILHDVGAFPLNRDGKDITVVRQVIGELKKGAAVAIFPQGTRHQGRRPLREDMKDGASFMALMSSANVVPVGIYTKKFKYLPFRKVYVSFGEPFKPSDTVGRGRDGTEKATDMIFEAICTEIDNAEKMAAEKK